MSALELDLRKAHSHSSEHRAEIEQSELCGCFYCKRTYPSNEIYEWVDQTDGVGQTALCPRVELTLYLVTPADSR